MLGFLLRYGLCARSFSNNKQEELFIVRSGPLFLHPSPHGGGESRATPGRGGVNGHNRHVRSTTTKNHTRHAIFFLPRSAMGPLFLSPLKTARAKQKQRKENGALLLIAKATR
jgi:hypothetical protein